MKIVIGFSLALLLSCTRRLSVHEISCLSIDYILPLPGYNEGIIEKKFFYKVYKKGDLLAYQVPYTFDSLFDNALELSEMRVQTFVFHKDSLHGYSYDNKTVTRNNNRVLKDSLISEISIENKKLDVLVGLQPISTYTSRDLLVETYSSDRLEPSTPFKYEISLYYSNVFPTTNESFSRVLERAKGKKLFKVVVDFPAGYSPELNRKLPRRTAVYEMKKCTEINIEVDAFFKKYEKEHS